MCVFKVMVMIIISLSSLGANDQHVRINQCLSIEMLAGNAKTQFVTVVLSSKITINCIKQNYLYLSEYWKFFTKAVLARNHFIISLIFLGHDECTRSCDCNRPSKSFIKKSGEKKNVFLFNVFIRHCLLFYKFVNHTRC